MLDKLICTYKCEHARVNKEGVVSCPYLQKQKKWIKENLFIKQKMIFPSCPKRLQQTGQPLVCATFKKKRMRRKVTKK